MSRIHFKKPRSKLKTWAVTLQPVHGGERIVEYVICDESDRAIEIASERLEARSEVLHSAILCKPVLMNGQH